MKRNILNLIIVLLATSLFMSSCKKDNYAPSLTLQLEPYVVYYENQKYTLYDEEGNKDTSIPSYVEKQGDIQSYIDLNTLLAYSVDDNGEFWSAEYLNSTYNYPKYKVSSYGDTEPTVTVDFDETIGIVNESGIDLARVGIYTFTYTATDEGEKSEKKVHLRVYNSYSNLSGIYVSRLSKLNVGGAGVSKWTDNYGYGEAKIVKFDVDGSVDKKMKLNRILNNSSLKGVIKGELRSLPTTCVLGDKKNDIHDVIETIVQGEIVDNDSYIATFPIDQRDTVTTLVVMSNRMVDNLTTGEIKEITVKDGDGNEIQVPLIAIEYSVRRYRRNNNSNDYQTSDGQTWESLDSGTQNWENTFRETYVKQVYWTEVNKQAINDQSGHVD